MSDAEDRESGRESEESDEEEEVEDDITKRTRLATEQMKKTFNGEATEEDIDRFFHDHKQVLTQEASRDGTFLHRIAQLVYAKEIRASDVKPLVKRLMEDYPYLLRTKNDDGQNPLYRAIQLLKAPAWKLVDYMLSNCSDPQAISDAVEMPCGEDRSAKTCLALAFEKGMKDQVLQKLISHASDKALELRDGSGRTPFHCAVEYDQCSDKRVGVVRLLLEKDWDAVMRHKTSGTSKPLETFLDYKYKRREDHVEYSVYGEHERTAKVYQDKVEKLAREEREEAKARDTGQERGDSKASNLAIPSREKDARKGGLDKGPKSRTVEERDRRGKKPERDSEGAKQELQNLDENERRRQELKEQEREAQERKAKEDKRNPKDPKERTKQLKDPKASPDGPILAVPRSQSDHAPNTSLKRVATQRFDIPTDDERKKRDKKVSSKRSTTKGPDSSDLARNSAKILNMLKLHYMRTRSVKMANSFLQGKNFQQDIQIFFDYRGLPSEIQDTAFNGTFGKDGDHGIRFDEVLMYVRFPNVTVIQKGRRAPKPRAPGRQDMEFFFNWLYAKGVRRILKVEVEDSDKIPHSDESITLSLEKIVVEHLDWQKTDLDPQVICQLGKKADHPSFYESDAKGNSVGPKNQLREVTLKWSGNNAVLRAWSESEGLPQLENLEAINLNIPPQSDLFDTSNWVATNLEEFRARLNRNANENRRANMTVGVIASAESGALNTSSEHRSSTRSSTPLPERSIEVRQRQGKKGAEVLVSAAGLPKAAGRFNPMTEHEWLNCMEKFAEHMNELWRKTTDASSSKLGQDQADGGQLLSIDSQTRSDLQNLQKPVVVALIDDGVDSCDPAFSGRVIEGVTFDYQDRGVGQYYISGRGHGTEMARMICKVCPMASIYSIRLKTHSSPDRGHSTIDAASAALAIEAALEKNATIISMSWTIPVPAEGSEEKKLLDSVLKRACERKVLMFCSSSDQISDPNHYPSAFNRDQFFVIGAAHDDGTAYGHAGKNNDFIFPGVNVNTSGGRSLPLYLADKTSSTKESTGSSIATALAAGLAAMITYCFKASALATVMARTQQGKDYVAGPELVKKGDVDRIAEHDVLKKAFSRIGKVGSGQFIPVWDRFGPASRYLEEANKSDEDKLECIMNLCSNLIER
ncbi:hypothetical protein AUP68_14774 [Ilyonectria robusta]